MSIRTLIADDQKIVRSGIKAELHGHKDFEIVGEAATGEMALNQVMTLTPDILLLDISMPGMKSTEVVQRIHVGKIPVHILIFTGCIDREIVSEMVRLGVDGFLLKDEDPVVLPDAIRKIARGQKWVSAKVIDFLMEIPQAPESKLEQALLSDKEINVLRLLSEGKTTKEMTMALGIKERTVEYYIKNINVKLGTSTRAQAVACAKDYGIL